jgi:dTDP-4-dehydrorhamnose reductase
VVSQFSESQLAPRLLITGASGFLGWQVCRQAQAQWRVVGTYHSHPVAMVKVEMQAVDLTDTANLKNWLMSLAPDAVIHTAALSQPNRCELQPAASYAMNVEVTRTLADYCGQRQIPFVFTSSDQVFDGQAAPYQETDPPNPINTYGRHKAEAEQLIQELHPGAAICRMPLMYGPPSPGSECFLQGFMRTLKAGQPLHLFVDEYRSPAYVEDAAQGLLLMLERRGKGIFHLSGPERLSRYDFGLRIADIFGLDQGLIVASQQADVAMPAARPADVSSESTRARQLGYHPRSIMDGLRQTTTYL